MVMLIVVVVEGLERGKKDEFEEEMGFSLNSE